MVSSIQGASRPRGLTGPASQTARYPITAAAGTPAAPARIRAADGVPAVAAVAA